MAKLTDDEVKVLIRNAIKTDPVVELATTLLNCDVDEARLVRVLADMHDMPHPFCTAVQNVFRDFVRRGWTVNLQSVRHKYEKTEVIGAPTPHRRDG